jgi:hypothetical protein
MEIRKFWKVRAIKGIRGIREIREIRGIRNRKLGILILMIKKVISFLLSSLR